MGIETLIERLNQDNGNCMAVGGFCTSVPAAYCPLIPELLARAEAAEAWAEKAESIASDLCDDFTDFVTGGVPNAAPYCANWRPECVDGRGWCNGDNRVCKGFLPKAAGVKEE